MKSRIPATVVAATLLLALASCSKDDEPAAVSASQPGEASEPSAAPTSSPSPTAAADAEEDGVTVRLDFVGGEPTERPEPNVDIDAGERFTLIVTSDEHMELHVHGYDKYLEVSPGEEAKLSFVADEEGSWLVENHHTGEEVFNLRVR